MNTWPEETDEDRDSLFGSPPPSPRRTGTASPILPLPGTGSSGSRLSASTAPATKNVGTIALPGSHPDSELPINPLALSLNHGIVQRPPAQTPPNASQQRNTSPQIVSTAQSLIIPTRATSSKPKAKKRTRHSSQSSKDSTPRPSGPEFALPDPSAPPPPNFLRNQEKLLGKAGLVARVKPSTITHIRGSTPSRPILVTDDDDDTPKLGRQKPQLRQSTQPYIDPSSLVAPSHEEILSVLVAQKDIFPILQGVVKLVFGNLSGLNSSTAVPSQPTGFERSRSQGHTATDNPSGQPVKKRKLNRVPAGATDWDVPYPFEQGEGPDAYRQNWERERGKQLISQLMKLIKGAALKAATKKYVQQQKARGGGGGVGGKRRQIDGTSMNKNSDRSRRRSYYKLETETYGIEASSSTHTPIEGDETASQSLNTIHPTTQQVGSLPVTQQTTLEGMLDSSFGISELAEFGDLSAQLGSLTDVQTPTNFDSVSFDSWMNFFSTLDVPSSLPADSASSSHSSTPGPDDFSFSDIFSQQTLGDPTLDPSFSTSASDLSAIISSLLNQPQASPQDPNSIFSPPPSIPDTMIDPSLLSLSNPLSLNSAFMEPSMTPPIVQASSPIPSTSSFSGNDPATPASASWDMSLPDVYMASADGDTNGQGMWRRAMWNNFSAMAHHQDLYSEWDANQHDFGPLPDVTESISEVYGTTAMATAVDKGKGRAMDVDVGMDVTSVGTLPTPILKAQDGVRVLLESGATTGDRILSMSTPLEKARATRKSRKEDILKRAQEKRDRLQEELNRVKMQLWETTIEQAGLLQLARELDGASEEGSRRRAA